MSDFKVEVLGRKGPRRRKQKPDLGKRTAALHPKRSAGARIVGALRWLLKPRFAAWTAAALIAGVITYGTPHLLVTYRCSNVGTASMRCSECRYFGMQGMRNQLGPNWDCPVIAMLPVNWKPVLRKVVGE